MEVGKSLMFYGSITILKSTSKMKKIIMLITFFSLFSCQLEHKKSRTIKGNHYELTIAPKTKAVLILFPCYPCDINYTKTEAKFIKDLDKNGITTLLLDFNQKLYLTEPEKKSYSELLSQIFDKYELDKNNIYIGGFSSGGNISIILSNYLIGTKNSLAPKGVFAIDSPVDIEQLYVNANIDLKRNINNEAIEEGKFIIDLLEKDLGKPENTISKYEKLSPFTISTQATNNIIHLKNIKTRFYYELALDYHKKNSGREYKELNAYQLEQTYKALQRLGAKKTQCIITKDRGYRSDGSKNPHTWNLVERESLIKWIFD